MTPLEYALLILVVIWTLIFLVIMIALIIMVRSLKRALDRVNSILDNADSAVSGISSAAKLAAGGAAQVLLKAGAQSIKKVAKKTLAKKRGR